MTIRTVNLTDKEWEAVRRALDNQLEQLGDVPECLGEDEDWRELLIQADLKLFSKESAE